MSPSERNDADDALREKLEELESLLGKDGLDPTPSRIKIPVLDELVTEADFINSEDDSNLEQIEQQISDLAEKLEQKFSGELDELVSLLKNNLKSTIVEELRMQANLKPEDSNTEDRLNNGTNPASQGEAGNDV